MDFDKFMERDIIEFLDNQNIAIAEKAAGLREEEFDLYEITQDYTKEISKALEERDMKKAQQVFEDVKKKYFTAPEDSLSKKRFYIIMEEIYEKIKDFESKEEGKKSLFDTIRDYEEKGLFTNPELFHQNEEEKIHLIISTISRKEKELESITKKKGIEGKDLKEAVIIYRQLKNIIKKIPEKYNKDKTNAYNSALGWFYTIKKLKQRLGTKIEIMEIDQPTTPAKQATSVEEQLAKIRKLKEKIVESHAKISEDLKKEDLKSSISEYKNLKKLCEAFPHEMEEEKTALLADALSLYDSVKNLKQKLVHKTKQETADKHEEDKDQDKRKKNKS
ncbi:MAG: hypothetical protein KKE98_04295 [Nanoarchaeota archaeon]|nr:hypothetical protein [Nanoarchaeota archaeon]